jgi:hypothetical protein
MCKYLVINVVAVSHIWLCTRSNLNFLIYVREKKNLMLWKVFFIESMWSLIIGACYYKNERKKLSRPTYIIAILLWRKYIWIRERNVNKSANRLYSYIYALKVHLQFISSYACVKIKYTPYISSTYFFHLATKLLILCQFKTKIKNY